MDITAIILAGGRGSRMGNLDKAWVPYQGKPLIRHTIENIETDVKEIIISYNRSNARFASLPYRRFTDASSDFQGPLSGLESCAPHIRTSLTLVVPCDMPLLPRDLTARLHASLGTDHLVIAHDGQRLQPLIMLARTEVFETINDYLATGNHSAIAWCREVGHAIASFSNDSHEFLNINKTEQLA